MASAGPRKTEAVSAEPRKTEAASAGPRRTEVASAGPRKTEAASAGPRKTEAGLVVKHGWQCASSNLPELLQLLNNSSSESGTLPDILNYILKW